MNKFFAPESKFAKGFTTLIDILILGVLWIFTSIPIFTIGTSSAALYYAIHKTIFQGRGYAYKEYFRGFKDNFKQGTLATLILLLFNAINYYLFWLTTNANSDRILSWNIVFVIIMGFSIMWGLLLFAFMSRFSNVFKANLKNSALIMFANLPVAVAALAVFMLFCLIGIYITKLIIILPGFLGVILHQIYERVFRKYMTEEDKALEDEQMMV